MFKSSKVVKTIFYVNILAFLLTMAFPTFMYSNMSMYDTDSQFYHIYQLLTYQFMHQGIMHIAFNMIVLLSFGPMVEEILGERKMWISYLLCGISGAMLHVGMTNYVDVPLVGASASIWGILVIFSLYYPNQKLYLFFLLGMKAKYLVSALFIVEVVSAIYMSDNVSHYGHIGGAIMGLLIFIQNKYARSIKR